MFTRGLEQLKADDEICLLVEGKKNNYLFFSVTVFDDVFYFILYSPWVLQSVSIMFNDPKFTYRCSQIICTCQTHAPMDCHMVHCKSHVIKL